MPRQGGGSGLDLGLAFEAGCVASCLDVVGSVSGDTAVGRHLSVTRPLLIVATIRNREPGIESGWTLWPNARSGAPRPLLR